MDINTIKAEASRLRDKLEKLLNNPDGLTKQEYQEATETQHRLEELKHQASLHKNLAEVDSWLKEPTNPFNPAPTKEVKTGYQVGGLTERQLNAITSNEYTEAFVKMLRGGVHSPTMTHSESKTLQEGYDQYGGFLVPDQLHNELTSKKPAPTSVVDLVRWVDAGRDAISFPRVDYTTNDTYTNPMRWSHTGELPSSAADVTSTTYGMTKIDVHTFMARETVSKDMIEDSAFDIMSFVTSRLYEAARLQTEDMILNGTGIEQPVGILPNAGGSVGNQTMPTTGSLGTIITGDKLIDLAYAIPAQYDNNCRWVFNKGNTARGIASLKDQNDRYLFGYGMGDSGLAGGRPTELLGYNFAYSPFMPDAFSSNGASGVSAAKAIIFGDFSGYVAVRRGPMSIVPLNEVGAHLNVTYLQGRWRFGGCPLESWKMIVGKLS